LKRISKRAPKSKAYIDDDEESVEIVPQVSDSKDDALPADDVVCLFLSLQVTGKLSKRFLRRFQTMSVPTRKRKAPLEVFLPIYHRLKANPKVLPRLALFFLFIRSILTVFVL
jgi:hypothetical protein